MTIPEAEALRLLRAVFHTCSAPTKKVLRERAHVPLSASTVPGWSYYVVSDSVKYTGYVVGGN